MAELFTLFMTAFLMVAIPVALVVKVINKRNERKRGKNEKCYRIDITINRE